MYLKKTLFLFLLIYFHVFLTSVPVYGQTFSLQRTIIDTVVNFTDEKEYELNANINNLTDSAVTLVYNLKSKTVPDGWIFYLCDPQKCNSPGPSSESGEAMLLSITGAQSFKAYIGPGSPSKIELEYEIYHKNEPAVKSTLKFTLTSLAEKILFLGTSSLTFTGLNNTQTVSISTNDSWTLTGLPTWLDINSITGTGNSNIKLTTNTYLPSGDKKAMITISGSDLTALISVFYNPVTVITGIYDDYGNKKIKISPNPVINGQIISFEEKTDVWVFDLIGNLIHSEKQVDHFLIKNFNPGVYFVKSGNNGVTKIIIQ